MKSQTAAEAVALAHLARGGWRPPRGEVKLISVADEETGGAKGAQWLTEQRPEAARVDMLFNEGGGAVMPFGRAPAVRRLLRREGHVPLPRARPRPRGPRLRARARRQRPAQAAARARAPRERPGRLRRGRRAARLSHRDRRGPGRSGRGPRSRACGRAAARRARRADPGRDVRADDDLRRGEAQRDPGTGGVRRRLPPAARARARGGRAPGARADGRRRRRARARLLRGHRRQPVADRDAADGRDPRLGRASATRPARRSR